MVDGKKVLSTLYFGTLFTLAYRCFQVCSSWTRLNSDLLFLKQIFLENGCHEHLMNTCFERFMDNLHLVKETTLTVEKKPLV